MSDGLISKELGWTDMSDGLMERQLHFKNIVEADCFEAERGWIQSY